jgi:hypothetical protein
MLFVTFFRPKVFEFPERERLVQLFGKKPELYALSGPGTAGLSGYRCKNRRQAAQIYRHATAALWSH